MASDISETLNAFIVDGRIKGYPPARPSVALGEIGSLGLNLLRGDLPFPVAVIDRAALEHNSDWMRRFTEAFGVRIAPHGKTTMSPALFHRQLADGAWAITVATAQQLKVCRDHGIGRVVMANQLVDEASIAYVLDQMAGDPDFEFYSLVDSPALAARLAARHRAAGLGRPLRLLLEIGYEGGRTGCRNLEQVQAVRAAVREAGGALSLAGVEGFEGMIAGADAAARDRNIRAFSARIVEAATLLAADGAFGDGPVILSAGGSAFFDIVAGDLAAARIGAPVLTVIRSGCYLTHDSRMYRDYFEQLRHRTPEAGSLGEGLRPALEVWAMVQSRPEPGLAICTMGRRDVSFDADLPVPWHVARAGEGARAAPEGWRVSGLNDQHAYLRIPEDAALAVGDLVGFGVSHPCTTFDRWQLVYLREADYSISGAIRTFF
ncbi:amino acid deaminase [Oceanibacterium hippocampi]|uniref:D-threonine aldolase n=1 Tax=Oceanibacterium hippocampi TaxID=745714 RepID=A0A1Y5T8Z3_9PROT|nr:amino acid deaminase [Oceanibacterium hippocampi]SLN58436.1 D-threonine aldolase [Oceanibacterium hippocampi]